MSDKSNEKSTCIKSDLLTIVDQWRNGLGLGPRLLGVELLGQLVERVLVDRLQLIHVVLQNVAVEEQDKVLDNLWDLNLLVLLGDLICLEHNKVRFGACQYYCSSSYVLACYTARVV